MGLKKYDYIVYIADEGNITKAAEKLYITRSALNHHLLELEEELGMPLFKRLRNRLVPTEAGELYIAAAREMRLIQSQLDKSLQDLRDGTRGTLSFGITRGIGTTTFGAVFPKFREKYPNYTLNLREGNILELEELLLKGEIDLAWSGLGVLSSPLEHLLLESSEILLAVPKSHPLAQLAQGMQEPPLTDLKFFKNDQFVLMTKMSKIREITDFFFQKAGFEPQILFESSTINVVHKLAKEGMCLTFIPKALVTSYEDCGYFSLHPDIPFSQTISYRKGTYFSEAEWYWISLLKEYHQRKNID